MTVYPRSDTAWKKAYRGAGLELIHEQVQHGFPEGLYEVKMFVHASVRFSFTRSRTSIPTGMRCNDFLVCHKQCLHKNTCIYTKNTVSLPETKRIRSPCIFGYGKCNDQRISSTSPPAAPTSYRVIRPRATYVHPLTRHCVFCQRAYAQGRPR